MRLIDITVMAEWPDHYRRRLVNGLTLLFMAPLLAFSLSRGIPLSPGGLCMVYAAGTVFAGLLLLPLPVTTLELAGWSMLAMLTTWLPLALQVAAATAVPPALASGVLLFLLGSLLLAADARQWEPAVARLVIVLLFLLATSAPVWLGPLAEQWADTPGVVDTVGAISPLSYLAAAAHEDYLRSEWFYRQTPLGSLRYNYLPATWYTGIYLLIALGVLAVRYRRLDRQRSRFTSELKLPLSTG